jgi:hypothetical protein
MKRLFALIAVLMVSACAQSGDGFVQDPPPVDPNPQPDPIITTPINSRFTGRVAATVSGEAKDFDAVLEYREQQAGKLIGYGQLRDRLAKNALFLDYWQEGQRTNADVTFNLRISGESCVSIKIKGKLNANGDIAVPKASQLLCGAARMTTEAFNLKREGEANKFNWKKIEAYFAGK